MFPAPPPSADSTQRPGHTPAGRRPAHSRDFESRGRSARTRARNTGRKTTGSRTPTPVLAPPRLAATVGLTSCPPPQNAGTIPHTDGGDSVGRIRRQGQATRGSDVGTRRSRGGKRKRGAVTRRTAPRL